MQEIRQLKRNFASEKQMTERLKRELMTLKPMKFRKGIGFLEDSILVRGTEARQFLL
jgi:predicted RNase H-like nuclease (RuvC/YqgF family)